MEIGNTQIAARGVGGRTRNTKEAHGFQCMDCSRTYHPFQLQADHRPGTDKRGLRIFPQWSRETILKELAKCDCVCANCHTLRTYVLDWLRQTAIYSQQKGCTNLCLHHQAVCQGFADNRHFKRWL